VKDAESRLKIFERFGRFNPYPTHEGLESSWSSRIPVNDEHDNESLERFKKKGKKGAMTPTICRSCGQEMSGGEKAVSTNPNLCPACDGVPDDMMEAGPVPQAEAALPDKNEEERS
jgi:hypothetical protein